MFIIKSIIQSTTRKGNHQNQLECYLGIVHMLEQRRVWIAISFIFPIFLLKMDFIGFLSPDKSGCLAPSNENDEWNTGRSSKKVGRWSSAIPFLIPTKQSVTLQGLFFGKVHWRDPTRSSHPIHPVYTSSVLQHHRDGGETTIPVPGHWRGSSARKEETTKRKSKERGRRKGPRERSNRDVAEGSFSSDH